MIITQSQKHRADKSSQEFSIVWPVWLNSWVFVYKLSSCSFELRSWHLNFKYRDCFGQGGNYRVQTRSETPTWHNNNTYSPVITVHTLRKKEEIKTVSFLTRLHSFLVPWRSLNWLNSCGRENIYITDSWDGCKLVRKNREVKNCWGIEQGSVSGGCKDEFVKK